LAEVLQLVRADEALTDRDLQVRPLELHAVADNSEVHVLLAALRREGVEIALWCDLRQPDIRRLRQLNDPHVMRVGQGQEAVPAGMRNRSAAELAFARIPSVGRLARLPVERVRPARDRA